MTNTVEIELGQTWVQWLVQSNTRLLREIRFSSPRAVRRILVGHNLHAARRDSVSGAPADFPFLGDEPLTRWAPSRRIVLMAGVAVVVELDPGEAGSVEFEHDALGGFNERA